MNNLITDIVQYLKQTYQQNQNIIEDFENKNFKTIYQKTKISFINEFQGELDKIYYNSSNEKYLKPLTNSQKKLFKKIYNLAPKSYLGGLTFIRRENTLINNINNVSINLFYPNIIKLYHQNTINLNWDAACYSYLVENYSIIKKSLNKNEFHLFKYIINYRFGILMINIQFNQINVQTNIAAFGNTYLGHMLKSDFLEDMIYIDTDEIYY